jgi:V/A-type H+-transporting ATPase subunit E
MQTKLQELTEKIYQEGVNKANEEAEKIINSAKKEADGIVSGAKKEAEDIVKDAKKEAEELKKNSMNELQLSARQLISDTQQKIVKLIEAEAVEPQIKDAFKDAKFTRDVVLEMVKNWDPKADKPIELKVLLPEKKQKEFEEVFKDKAKDILNKGLEISFSDKIKGGFKIGPKEGGYLISFTDEDFDNFFRAYLRPRLIEMLYESK